jgi:hypothetical protein
MWFASRNHPMALRCRRVGAVHSIISGPQTAAGDCPLCASTNSFKSGDKSYETWEEGSHLKEYTYKKTGGTGKYTGTSGSGTYMYEGVTDTVFGGRYKGQLILP